MDILGDTGKFGTNNADRYYVVKVSSGTHTMKNEIIIDVRIRLVPAQDVHYFYTRSHFNALQNCAVLFSTNFQIIFLFKNALHNLVIELCSALIFLKNNLQLYINFTHSFVAIELLTFCKIPKKLFYCSRELSLFWPNK